MAVETRQNAVFLVEHSGTPFAEPLVALQVVGPCFVFVSSSQYFVSVVFNLVA